MRGLSLGELRRVRGPLAAPRRRRDRAPPGPVRVQPQPVAQPDRQGALAPVARDRRAQRRHVAACAPHGLPTRPRVGGRRGGDGDLASRPPARPVRARCPRPGRPRPAHRGRLRLPGPRARRAPHRWRPSGAVRPQRRCPASSCPELTRPRFTDSERAAGLPRRRRAPYHGFRPPRARRGYSSVGRALQSHCRGQRFDSA